MGFLENWFNEKMNAFGPASATLQPSNAGAATLFGFNTAGRNGDAKARRSAAGAHPGDNHGEKPAIDPAVLQTILPRDGNAALTVSGLDGVLTVGKDMVMATDQPIRCETIRVLGTLKANVFARRILVGESGAVFGEVHAQEAEIRGCVDGLLQVRGTATLYARARAIGKVRALDVVISADANVRDADIKRVVPRSMENDDTGGPIMAFDDGYASMHITVTHKAALRRF